MIRTIESPTSVARVETLLEYLSPSAVKDYLGCSLRYFFGRVLRLPQPASESLVLGKAVHAALRLLHLARWRDEPFEPQTALTEFDEALHEFIEADELSLSVDDLDALKTKGRDMVDAYSRSEHCSDGRKVLGVEIALREHFPHLPADLAGQVDLILETPEGELVPVDFKTCANTPNPEIEAFQHELQLVFYQLLIEAATERKVAYREIVYITKHKTPRVIVQQIPAADEIAIERFWRMIESVHDGVLDERWVPQPGMQCAWCSFRRDCVRWSGKGGAS